MKIIDSFFPTAPELQASADLIPGGRRLQLNFRLLRNGLRILDFERLIFLNECGMLRRRISLSLIKFMQRRDSAADLAMRKLVVPRADYHFKLLGRIHDHFWPDDKFFANADELPLRHVSTSN